MDSGRGGKSTGWPRIARSNGELDQAHVGGGDAGVPDSAKGSPFLTALTKVTVVFASGLNALIMESSQVNATGQ